ncbi:acyl carrier protein [Solwaraspora sp. WMMB335]|uniref:acyl carrier protein n=1 Tax=Solwaraspora sp. WMMB335 TaxID=3404118 RepID=UPI003B93633A
MSPDPSIPDIVADLLDLDPDQVTEDTALTELDGWDSVNALRVLMYLERRFARQLDYERFTTATTVGELAAVVGPVRVPEGPLR